jgi:hypothetical protein
MLGDRHQRGVEHRAGRRVGLAAREQQEEVVAEVDLPDQVAREVVPRTTMVSSLDVQMAERGTVALPIFKCSPGNVRWARAGALAANPARTHAPKAPA